MIQRIWYSVLRRYVWLGLHFYFRKIQVVGIENIPAGAVIFAANHQNALLDALLIACFNPTPTNFLARADIFRRPFIGWLLGTFKMIPIFRIRDGWQLLGENQKSFAACDLVFQRGESVVIFPEGNHDSPRRLRPLSKGFARVAFYSLMKHPGSSVSVVPVGLNYTDPQAFRSSVSIYFGKPILASEYVSAGEISGAHQLRLELSLRMKQLTTHVETPERYDEIIQQLEGRGVDYLDPVSTNQRINQLELGQLPEMIQSPARLAPIPTPLYWLAHLVNLPPRMLLTAICKRIKDPIFIPTIKFGVGIFLFPPYYLIVGLILGSLLSWTAAGIWWALSLFSTWLLARH